jgi:hypothetical protein
MRLAQSFLVSFGTDAHHQVVARDAAEHPAVEKKGDAAEHLLLGDAALAGDGAADPVCELRVVGHRAY